MVPPWGLLAQSPGPWGVGDRLAPSAGTGTVAAFGYGRQSGMCPHFAESRVTTPDAPLGLMGPWLAVLEPWSEGSAGERGPVCLRLLMGTGWRATCWLPAPVRPWWQLCAGPYWPRVLCPQPCLVPLPQMPVAMPLGSSQTREPSVRRGGWAPRGWLWAGLPREVFSRFQPHPGHCLPLGLGSLQPCVKCSRELTRASAPGPGHGSLKG